MEYHPASEAPQMHMLPDGTSRPETEEERITRVKQAAAIRARLTKIQATADKHRMTPTEREDFLAASIARLPGADTLKEATLSTQYTDYRPADRVLWTDPAADEHHVARVAGRDDQRILIIKLDDHDEPTGSTFYASPEDLIMIEKGAGHPPITYEPAAKHAPAQLDAEELLAGIIDDRPKVSLQHGTLNEYQVLAETTAIYPGVGTGSAEALVYTLGNLASEGGEGIGHYVKELRKSGKLPTFATLKPETRDLIIGELGDNLWQTAMAAKELGITLEEVARRNLYKLQSRQARGTINGSGDNR